MTRLKRERVKRGWNQQDLGFHARISSAEICRFERGQAKPYPAQACRLAKVLGILPEELLLPAEDSTTAVA